MSCPFVFHIIDEVKVGGAQTHLVTMLREALKNYSLEHRVVSLFGDGVIGDEIRALGVPLDVLDLGRYPSRKRFLAAAGILQELFFQCKPELVEAHLTWSRLVGLYAAWRANVPRRVGFEQGDIYLNSWKFRAANFVGQYFAQNIIVCSQALADWNIRTHGIFSGKLKVFPNCVDPDKFNLSRIKPTSLKFGLSSTSTIFCAVGSLGTGVNKRVDVCIRAVAAARAKGADVSLVVVGDGNQRKNLEDLSSKLNVGLHIKFLGVRTDVPEIMAECDAFCHAAPFEPFGIVCLEAMAMCLPVIVPDSGGIREIIDEGVTGLLYPVLNHEILAQKMLSLHRNPDLRKSLGLAARAKVEGRYSVVSYVKRYYALCGLGERRRGCDENE